MEAFASGHPVIVRSSSLSEDSSNESRAGKYLSVLNVQGIEEIMRATAKVMLSFEDGKAENIIFIQPMVENILFSGVVFTADPKYLLEDSIQQGKNIMRQRWG